MASLKYPGGSTFEERFVWTQEIADQYGFKSSYFDIDVDDLEEIPYLGATTLVDMWGNRDERTEIAQPPTWLNLWAAADKMIGIHADHRDHRYIESFEPEKDQSSVLRLWTGS